MGKSKKGKKKNGMKEFAVTYSFRGIPGTAVVEAIDKYFAIMKFKETNPGAVIKDVKEIIPPKPEDDSQVSNG